MRRKVLGLILGIGLLLSGTLPLRAQVPSSCVATAEFRAVYDREVKFLALEAMFARQSPDTALIDIPAAQQIPVMEGLAAIFNTGRLMGADSVFSLYCIQTDPVYRTSSQEVQLRIDTSFSWTHQWLNNQTATGVILLDKTLAQYGFAVASHVLNPPDNYTVILRTDQAINTHALADSLRSFPGIIYAAAGTDMSVMNPLNRISYTLDANNNRHFSCRLGWGNLNYVYWNYKVNASCTVERENFQQYVNEALPPLKNCNLLPTAVQQIAGTKPLKLFPNPAVAYIEWPASVDEAASYCIYDGAGREVQRGSSVSRSRIAVMALPAGIYFFNLITANGARFGARFLKQ